MKILTFITAALLFLNSCSYRNENQRTETGESIEQETIQTEDTMVELPAGKNDQTLNHSKNGSDLNAIPPNGTYRYDIAFAEWQGKSMGEKVTVEIKGDSIKIVYEGDGKLVSAKKGTVLDEGLILKHKSGDWIIGTQKSDKDVDVYGGCSGGPAIIDFKNKKYWMC